MVPREEGRDAVPFMFEWMFFQHGEKESGLYCLIDAEKESTEEIVNLFKELGSLGIGSDRTVGGGMFDVEVDEVEWKQETGNAVILLSTYIPQESEIEILNLPSSNYSILKRGGFIAGSYHENIRHLRRKTIYMFEAGSVFLAKHSLEGTIVDLAPQWNSDDMHPVYRSGRPFYVTVNLKKDEE
jgi:CRISPR type III-A-associated RAMP protein Csm4